MIASDTASRRLLPLQATGSKPIAHSTGDTPMQSIGPLGQASGERAERISDQVLDQIRSQT